MASASDEALTPKQARFVAEYLKDLNGKQAAIRAGYAPKAAEVTASRMLTVAKVAAALAAAQAARAARTGVTQDRVLEELALLSFSSVAHYVLDDDGQVAMTPDAPPDAMRAVSSIKRKIVTRGSGKDKTVTREVELKLWDKPASLRMSGQHLGMFIEQHEHRGKNGGPIETVVTFGGRYRPPAKKG